jgi:UPF0716 family protein affecting phage T7 exclusion
VALLNRLEAGSYILLVCISLLFTSFLPPYPLITQVIALLLILPPTALLVGFILYQERQSSQAERKRKATESLQTLTASKDSTMELQVIGSKDGPTMDREAAVLPLAVAPAVVSSSSDDSNGHSLQQGGQQSGNAENFAVADDEWHGEEEKPEEEDDEEEQPPSPPSPRFPALRTQ